MNTEITTNDQIELDLNSTDLKLSIDTIVANCPFTRDTIITYTDKSFFNSTNEEEFSSRVGFLKYYRSLNPSEVYQLELLFQAMSNSLWIFGLKAFGSTPSRIAIQVKQEVGDNVLYINLPSNKSLVMMLSKYNWKHFNCLCKLENLLLEAGKAV